MGIHQQVLGFDVPVDDLLLPEVQVLQSFHQIFNVGDHSVLWE